MKIVFFGDVVARSGRDALLAALPTVLAKLNPDIVIVNGENAAHGFGITKDISQDFFKAGVDVITTGNHVYDRKESLSYVDQETRLIRPLNYPPTAPGRGSVVVTARNGEKVLVANAMARLFMDALDDPFAAVDALLKRQPMGSDISAIVLDFHGEASSEKMTMGHFCDGRVSLVVGTHTHIPTADCQILPLGTAYQTDAGMCGDYNSVVGMDKATPLHRFTRKIPGEKPPMFVVPMWRQIKRV